jgi:hypothetical protein
MIAMYGVHLLRGLPTAWVPVVEDNIIDYLLSKSKTQRFEIPLKRTLTRDIHHDSTVAISYQAEE